MSGRRRWRCCPVRVAAGATSGVEQRSRLDFLVIGRGERRRCRRREPGCCPLHSVLQPLGPFHTLRSTEQRVPVTLVVPIKTRRPVDRTDRTDTHLKTNQVRRPERPEKKARRTVLPEGAGSHGRSSGGSRGNELTRRGVREVSDSHVHLERGLHRVQNLKIDAILHHRSGARITRPGDCVTKCLQQGTTRASEQCSRNTMSSNGSERALLAR